MRATSLIITGTQLLLAREARHGRPRLLNEAAHEASPIPLRSHRDCGSTRLRSATSPRLTTRGGSRTRDALRASRGSSTACPMPHDPTCLHSSRSRGVSCTLAPRRVPAAAVSFSDGCRSGAGDGRSPMRARARSSRKRERRPRSRAHSRPRSSRQRLSSRGQRSSSIGSFQHQQRAHTTHQLGCRRRRRRPHRRDESRLWRRTCHAHSRRRRLLAARYSRRQHHLLALQPRAVPPPPLTVRRRHRRRSPSRAPSSVSSCSHCATSGSSGRAT